MKKKACLLFGFMGCMVVHAQDITPSIINSAGGTASVSGYIIDWSFCEVTLASTFSTPNLIVTQGVLQNDPDGNSNGIHNPVSFKKNIKVFPNPFRDIIYLQSEDKSEAKFQYVLLDINGRLISGNSGDITLNGKTEEVNLSGLPAGTYVLKITESKKHENLTQSYKVQKIN